jgi:hypothetical protein
MSSTRSIIERGVKNIVFTSSKKSYLCSEEIDNARLLMNKILIDGDESQQKSYEVTHAVIIAKLAKILSTQQIHFPLQHANLNVISLGCGIPDDYFALKALLQKNNNPAVINYVGVDINLKPTYEPGVDFSQYPEMKLITADATDPEVLKTVLSSADAVPEKGFDIIFLRHPEILSHDLNYPFQRMIRSVIPFLSGEKSSVFISAYLSLEMLLINASLNIPDYTVLPDNKLTISGVISSENVHGNSMEPENFSIVMHCSGSSLVLKPKSVNSLSITRNTL